jgi:hypothetical protein
MHVAGAIWPVERERRGECSCLSSKFEEGKAFAKRKKMATDRSTTNLLRRKYEHPDLNENGAAARSSLTDCAKPSLSFCKERTIKSTYMKSFLCA